MKEKVNIAVIGHLDHGKSTLIGRLIYDANSVFRKRMECIIEEQKNREGGELSMLLDSFQEEREGKLTMDTTQAILRVKGLEYNFIDCPGHKALIQNMLTGASQGEYAILVVSAKRGEGIREQAKMHVNLVNLLGVKTLLVAVNKMDTVDYKEERFIKLEDGIKNYLKLIDYEKKISFVPLSAKYGENIIKKSRFMKWYKGKPLLGMLNAEVRGLDYSTKKVKPLRIFIQSVYNNGRKRILLGKIERGTLKVNDSVFMNISRQRGTVKEIVADNGNKMVSHEGECVGLILEGIDLDDIKRGEVITNLHSKLLLVKKIKANVFFLKKRPKDNTEFLIKCALREVNCKIKLLSHKEEIYKVDIFLKEPLVVESITKTPGLGRFVLIDKRAAITGLGRVDA